MSGPERRFTRRLLTIFNTYLTNLKQLEITKRITPSLKRGQEGSAETLKKIENYKASVITPGIKNAILKYEKLTGVEELMLLQKTVVSAQEKFITAQEKRRQAGLMLSSLQVRIQELHAEMQNTSKADERYLKLITEEHKTLVQERHQRQLFEDLEREERERFAEMSSAVKMSHEQERANAERSKYWYIVASIFGTMLGIAGSTVNNRLKMSQFKDLMEEQMNRSASMMLTAAGGEKAVSNYNAIKYLPSESIAQLEQLLTQKIQELDVKVSGLSDKYARVVDSLHVQESVLKKNFTDLRQLFVTQFQSSSKSDKKLAELMVEVVSHEDRIPLPPILDTNVHNDMPLLKVVSVLTLALVLGCVLGKIS